MAAIRVLVALCLLTGLARADGEITARGAYYKEDATRVAQPMMDARFEVGDDGELTTHALVDAITSASVAAGASGEPFTELRYEAGAGYLHAFGDLAIGGFARYSDEPDYTSMFAGIRGRAALARDNTIVDLALSAGHDELSNGGAQGMISEPITGELDTLMASLGVTQVLSPRVVAGVTYDLIHLDGFLANPYRSVAAGGMMRREAVPDRRIRHALAGSLRGFMPGIDATLVAGYRLYVDDWGILAHTPEVRWIQPLSSDSSLQLRYRYYRQTGAEFYRHIYDDAGAEFVTDDPKLSAFTTQTLGLKLATPLSRLGFGGDWRADLLVEYIRQDHRFGDAVAGSFAITVPFTY